MANEINSLKKSFAKIAMLVAVLILPFFSVLFALALLLVLSVIYISIFRTKEKVNIRKFVLIYSIVLVLTIALKMISVVWIMYKWEDSDRFRRTNDKVLYRMILGLDYPAVYERAIYDKFRDLSSFNKGDPFVEGSFKRKSNAIYSVGPDGLDDHIKILYDPTNGILSRGDILVLRYDSIIDWLSYDLFVSRL